MSGLLPLLLGAVAMPCGIRVVDAETGRGVPLVELETVNKLLYVTDSAGWVAIDEPGLLGQRVWFHVRSHGYTVEPDGFGYRGFAAELTPGGRVVYRLRRRNLAERLYRLTGQGIYRDSLLLGEPVPLREPALAGQVMGQDSVLCARYKGRIFWFWGDTDRPGYPLGNFHTSGATSLPPEAGGLEPAVGVDLDYFTRPDGFAAEVCPMAGDGPTWISGLAAVRDAAGELLLAGFVKIKPPLAAYRWGLAEWDDAADRFREVVDLGDREPPAWLRGHAVPVTIDGERWLLLGDPWPLVRVRPSRAALLEVGQYEAFTCRRPDGTITPGDWSWRRGAAALTLPDEERSLPPGQGLLLLRDIETGQPIIAHRGSVAWNSHRRRWTMIFCQEKGTSYLGEIWYTEADTPLGPWVWARKVVTHERYSFYNPRQHPELADGRYLYFEGTYTATFSGTDRPTPRYDYNQLMYRLDLDDPRLTLPVALWQVGERWLTARQIPAGERAERVIGFARETADGWAPAPADAPATSPTDRGRLWPTPGEFRQLGGELGRYAPDAG